MRRQLASQQVSVEVVTVVEMVVAVDSVGHVGSGMCEWQERTFPHVLRMVVILMFAMIRPHHGSISVNLGDARLVLKIVCGVTQNIPFLRQRRYNNENLWAHQTGTQEPS